MPRKDLDAILLRDPSNWEAATRHDYADFRTWVVTTYGRTAYNTYIRHQSI